tara:strand:- start:2735 stop:3562 length:828 start_codon:yes stop_codon:yes gene_type:complete
MVLTPLIKAEEVLRDIGNLEDSNIDLFEGALALAVSGWKEVSLHSYRSHLSKLTEDLGIALSRGKELTAVIREIVHRSYGYSGDTTTYDDLRNANIISVIDRRRGIPVSLGIIYLQAVRLNGVKAEGLSFPGHFLVRLGDENEQTIIDPFNGGIERKASDLRALLKQTLGLEAELSPIHYKSVGNRDILIRLQNNIKIRHERAGRIGDAIKVLEGILLFAPDVSALWRELGLLNASIGNIGRAVTSFERIIEIGDSAETSEEAAVILQNLKKRIN